MMLERRVIDRDNVGALIALRVRADQCDLVADNAVTLAEAPFETGARVWGLWEGQVPVGLLAMVHPDELLWHDAGDDRRAAYLWRLMIAAEHQGKGLGRAAIEEVLRVARDWHLPRVVAGVADRANSSLGFYERLGFRRTGRMVEGEVEIVRDL